MPTFIMHTTARNKEDAGPLGSSFEMSIEADDIDEAKEIWKSMVNREKVVLSKVKRKGD